MSAIIRKLCGLICRLPGLMFINYDDINLIPNIAIATTDKLLQQQADALASKLQLNVVDINSSQFCYLLVLTPVLFDAIHKQHLYLTTESAMRKFFKAQGVSEKDFNSVYNFSPGIGVELNRARNVMLAYKVFNVPSFVINGKYKTSAVMTQGNLKKLMDVITYLVKKEKKEGMKEEMHNA